MNGSGKRLAHPLLAFLAALAWLGGSSALAGSLTGFSQRDFNGEQMSLSGSVDDLSILGLRDRMASLIVYSGTYRMCTEPFGRGRCGEFPPGRYGDLGPFEYRAGSLVEIGWGGGASVQPHPPRPGVRPAEAVVYEREDFGGRSYTLRTDTPNFEYLGFNDSISSIYVTGGYWEFCGDAFYRGSCRTYGPGEYRRLGAESNRFSSARVKAQGSPGWGGGGGGGGGGPVTGQGGALMFDREAFGGRRVPLDGPVEDFERIGFNDAAASLVVHRGAWQFCTDAGYRGECRVYGPGEYASLGGQGDRYSSARPVAGGGWGGGAAPDWSGGKPRLTLFEHGDFGGRAIGVDHPLPDLERVGFNDRAESLIVEGGTWELCSDAQFRGNCRSFGPGRYPTLPWELRRNLSSLRQR